jgi:LacI family transcriptional regulator
VRGVSIRDVARTAEVSVATVSRVLANSEFVKAATREKVLAVIDELGYVANAHARALVAGGGNAVAFLTADMLGPSFADLASSVEQVAAEYGRLFVLCTTHNDAEREQSYIRLMAEQRAAAVLLVGAVAPDPAYERRVTGYAKELGAIGCPLVLCGRPPLRPGSDIPSVEYDNAGGGYDATQHLIELGHRRILFAGFVPPQTTTQARLAGARRAYEDAGLPAEDLLVPPSGFTSEAGDRAVTEALRERSPFTAVVAAADHVAIGCLRALRRAGLRVPEDVSLVGFDDIAVVSDLTPALTTVRVPFGELGTVSARIAMDAEERGRYRHIVLPTELVVRESTAPPM